jgi:hypothetical protein
MTYFYVFAALEEEESLFKEVTLCKFGRTVGGLDKRRREHEAYASKRWNLEINLECVFLGSTALVALETCVRNETLQWSLDDHDSRRSEWRLCHPCQLAEVVKDIADRSNLQYEVFREPNRYAIVE